MDLTHLLLKLSLNPKGPFCTSTFTSKFVIPFLTVHTRTKDNTSPLCMLKPQIIPLLTLTLVCTWYEESTPGGIQESSMTWLSNNHILFYTNIGDMFLHAFFPLHIGYGITLFCIHTHTFLWPSKTIYGTIKMRSPITHDICFKWRVCFE